MAASSSSGNEEGKRNQFMSPSDIDYERFLLNVKMVMSGKKPEWIIPQLDITVGQQVNSDECGVHPEVTGMVLIMIVKNESEIIRRCLDSVKDIVQGVCIVDTYSELPVDYNLSELGWVDKLDGISVPDRNEKIKKYCPDIIKDWARENSMPCEVPIHYFTRETFQFDMSRTLSFVNGRKYFPNAKYYITIDADMELKVNSDFKLEDLTKDAYFLYQQTATSRYPNVRIIKADTQSKVRACTHEFWSVKRKNPDSGKVVETEKGELHTLEIIDHDDGRYKETKFIRDKYLLERDMLRLNTAQDLRVRYLFYIAQSYMCLSKNDWAIDFYWLRHHAGHWDEERWYSLLNIGKIYLRKHEAKREELKIIKRAVEIAKKSKNGDVLVEGTENENVEVRKCLMKLSNMGAFEVAGMVSKLNDEIDEMKNKAIEVMHRAHEFRPTRAEPFYHLAKMYREIGNNDMGYYYATKAEKIGYPIGDKLFVETSIYNYLILFELSICGYYLPSERNTAVAAHRRLKLIFDQLPPDVKYAVGNNDKFYLC